MKKIIAISLLLILIISSVSAIFVNVYPYELSQGTNEMKVVVFDHKKSISDAKVSLTIPDLDVRTGAQDITIKRNKPVSNYFEVEVGKEVKPDYYPVRVVITDNHGIVKRTHTWVYVG